MNVHRLYTPQENAARGRLKNGSHNILEKLFDSVEVESIFDIELKELVTNDIRFSEPVFELLSSDPLDPFDDADSETNTTAHEKKDVEYSLLVSDNATFSILVAKVKRVLKPYVKKYEGDREVGYWVVSIYHDDTNWMTYGNCNYQPSQLLTPQTLHQMLTSKWSEEIHSKMTELESFRNSLDEKIDQVRRGLYVSVP